MLLYLCVCVVSISFLLLFYGFSVLSLWGVYFLLKVFSFLSRLSFPKLLLSVYLFRCLSHARGLPCIFNTLGCLLILEWGWTAEDVHGLAGCALRRVRWSRIGWPGWVCDLGEPLRSVCLGLLRVLRKGSSNLFLGQCGRGWLPAICEVGGKEDWKSHYLHVHMTPSTVFQ